MTFLIVPRILLALATALFVPIVLRRVLTQSKVLSGVIQAAGLAAAIGLLIPDAGVVRTVLVLPWFVVTIYTALVGLKRLMIWLVDDVSLLLINVGSIFLAVGGIWLLASTIEVDLIGFSEPWKTLTAIHFHYAAFLFPVCIGMMTVSNEDNKPPSILAAVASVYLMAIVLVAIGLSGFRLIELIGVSLFNLSAIFLLVYLLKNKRKGSPNPPLYTVGLGLGIFGVLLSLAYSWKLTSLLGFDTMALSHGLINALILTQTLISYGLKRFPAVDIDRRIPFSRLAASFRIGPNYFDSRAIEDRKSPAGLISSLHIFDRDGFQINRLDSRVAHFYEKTSAYELNVTAEGPAWFGFLWKLILGPTFKLLGQFNLPIKSEKIESRLVWLDSVADGRKEPVGWVRTDKVTGEAIYIAAYSTHTKQNVTYMNIAFPLPLSNMASILYPESNTSGNGIRLSTRSDLKRNGDQGVYLVTKWFRIRMPLNETIEVWYDSVLRARHEMWLFGIRYLTLNYEIIDSQLDRN